ncbi:MAG: iron-containing alcohol dehydrogenase [Deltaproteobacteria bacterium]|nr:iron-containing alcohol dehydrogenase [Deltaproteobacteria bacterium]
MVPEFYQFHCPTKVVFGVGLARDFSSELASLGIRRFLVVTDKVLVGNGLVAPIIEGIKKTGFEVVGIFSEIPPNSELTIVKNCASQAKELGAEGFIAIGGGSPIDTAKAANILFTLGGDLVGDYSGAQTISVPLSPLVAIPTTAGTGSEVSSAAVVLNEAEHTKLSFVDSHLYPTLALLDPELTITLPPRLTAATGMDALTHAIESYVSNQKNPVSDALALEAIRLIHRYLVGAVEDGKDREARSGMITASMLAGQAFDHAMVGVVHGMAHALGGLTGIHHGTANSIFLPWGMEYNLEARTEEYAEIGRILVGWNQESSDIKMAHAAIEEVVGLREKLQKLSGLPFRLRDAGVKEDLLGAIAEGAVDDGTSFYNPREVVKEEILKQVKKAY